MNTKRKTFCPSCNKEIEYKIKQSIIKRYKGIEVNVPEYVGVCNECGKELLVMELEIDNLNRLYRKYEEVTGFKIKSPVSKPYKSRV